ncbi:uncharacterized protein RCC_07142 [Ramularia collo-cygni]|uniref:F-box domain-containing protein n=1 Tax=Ramularia collo-cygni TaxID=112498 RepID=A0A2D3VH71_9PEZI|nr:uncharacterized protein RCC_07142 [Ramularia collo-cygni]CZT21279.1 uncharacterized protein RCC_07142 [Ramularia collo-cygni]
MLATNFDTLPVELLSYICELICHSHSPSLCALTLVNKNCESIASKQLFRDIWVSFKRLEDGRVLTDFETWEALLERRECFESVRSISVRGTLSPATPVRFYHNRKAMIEQAEWLEDDFDAFSIQEPEMDESEGSIFVALVGLIEKLSFLKTLRWAAFEQLPNCILMTLPGLRKDCGLEMPEFISRHADAEPRQDQVLLTNCTKLRSITARTVSGDRNEHLLLHMLSGATPSLKEVRLVKCEVLTAFGVDASEEVLHRRSRAIYERNELKSRARPTLFSIHGKDPIERLELERWFEAADMSSLRRLELRSGVNSAEVWSRMMRAQFLPHLRELLLGFPFDCTTEQHDAATVWMRDLFKVNNVALQKLELRGNIPPSLVNVTVHSHGKTLRKLILIPEAHQGHSYLRFSSRDLQNINTLCPALEELAVPLERGRAVGNEFHEAHSYAALGQFASLTHLHVILDCSRWGELRPDWILQGSGDDEFDGRTYFSLDARPILHRNVRYALVNSAVDETLARTVWGLITARKLGLPLHELYVQPAGSMELITGFRPDDRPELASRLVDLYAMLREVSRSYKITRHVRDDFDELVVREPPNSIPRGHWSKLDREERDRQEVVCHLNGVEMEIFRRIWPSRSLSWRDDWCSLQLPMPELST